MKSNTYKVKIRSATPYMQHRMDDQSLEDWEKNRGLIVERDDIAKEDVVRAEYHCYTEGDDYYIPSEHFRQALIGAGTYIKSKVGASSKSMKYIVAATFMVTPEKIALPQFDCIDKRSAVNRNNKARIIVIRPKWTQWSAEFELQIRNTTITKATIEKLFEYAGCYVGIGSFRPANTGLFGQFELESLTKI